MVKAAVAIHPFVDAGTSKNPVGSHPAVLFANNQTNIRQFMPDETSDGQPRTVLYYTHPVYSRPIHHGAHQVCPYQTNSGWSTPIQSITEQFRMVHNQLEQTKSVYIIPDIPRWCFPY